MARRAKPEQEIQKAVFQHLRQRGAPGIFAFHVPNGGYRRPVEAAIMKSLGVRAGVPDIIVIKSGHTFALELKAAGGKLSPAQSQAIDTMNQAGAIVGVAYGLDDALFWLEDHGLLIGRANGLMIGRVA